jgi:hypothetical protein
VALSVLLSVAVSRTLPVMVSTVVLVSVLRLEPAPGWVRFQRLPVVVAPLAGQWVRL